MSKGISIVLVFCLLFLATIPALAADEGTQAGQGTQVQTQGQQGPAGFFDRLQGKVTDLGSSLVPVMLIVAALVLMFSARHGKQMLVWIIAGAFLVLGGWKLLVDLVKFILQ